MISPSNASGPSMNKQSRMESRYLHSQAFESVHHISSCPGKGTKERRFARPYAKCLLRPLIVGEERHAGWFPGASFPTVPVYTIARFEKWRRGNLCELGGMDVCEQPFESCRISLYYTSRPLRNRFESKTFDYLQLFRIYIALNG